MSAIFTEASVSEALAVARQIIAAAEAAKRRAEVRGLAMSEALAIATKANREIDAMRICEELLTHWLKTEVPEPDHDHERAARKEAEARRRAPRGPGRYE